MQLPITQDNEDNQQIHPRHDSNSGKNNYRYVYEGKVQDMLLALNDDENEDENEDIINPNGNMNTNEVIDNKNEEALEIGKINDNKEIHKEKEIDNSNMGQNLASEYIKIKITNQIMTIV